MMALMPRTTISPLKRQVGRAWAAGLAERLAGWGWGCLVLFLGMLPSAAFGQFAYSTNQGGITITGYDCSSEVAVIPAVIDGLPVNRIGAGAFLGCRRLTSVTLPPSVTHLDQSAFQGCSGLKQVELPSGLRSIDALTFYGCSSLASLTLPQGVTNLGYYAFFRCTSLPSVRVPASVSRIEPFAFGGCSSLEAITVEPANPAYRSHEGVLLNRSGSVVLACPAGKGGSYTVPNGVVLLDVLAFSGCTRLSQVILPDSVTQIESAAFSGCTGLSRMALSRRVIVLGGAVFGGCSGLTGIDVDPANPLFRSEDGVLFNRSLTTLIQYPGGRAGDYVVVPSATRIGAQAFEDCPGLTRVTLPTRLASLGARAFAGCSGLLAAYFTGGAPVSELDTFAGADQATLYYLPGTLGWGATLSGRPTAPWALPNPVILAQGPGFGGTEAGFGLVVSWATNAAVVLEASADLGGPVWTPVATNTLAGGATTFSDPTWLSREVRFYRVVAP
jgi:hypothetical protein